MQRSSLAESMTDWKSALSRRRSRLTTSDPPLPCSGKDVMPEHGATMTAPCTSASTFQVVVSPQQASFIPIFHDEEDIGRAVQPANRLSEADESHRCNAYACEAICHLHCKSTQEPAQFSSSNEGFPGPQLALARQHHQADAVIVQQPGPLDEQSGDTAKWWFYCPERHTQLWDVAKQHWGIAAWDIARSNKLFYNCLELYAWRKRAHLTGHVDRYVRQQNLLIRKVQTQIQTKGVGRQFEPLTIVAIGILAYVSMLDSNLDVAGLHLQAIKRLDYLKHFDRFQHEWLYTIWVDLRYALLRQIPPVLAYFVPIFFRTRLEEAEGQRGLRASRNAGRNSKLSPHSDHFDSVESYSLFLRLHRLYEAYSASEFSKNPPYGLIYDLEYRLRILGAKEYEADEGDIITTFECVELHLTVVQLHVWILCRYCAPVSSYCRRHVLLQTLKILRKALAPIFVAKWKSVADMSSLLWILNTLTACSLEAPIDDDATIMTYFQYSLAISDVLTLDEISSVMRQWPWVDDWHTTKTQAVWEAIKSSRQLTEKSSSLLSPSSNWCFYVGAVEFYDS